jgi:acyl carrier protein
MTQKEVAAEVDKILVEGFEIEPTLLTPAARLIDDLGLDSLDAVDLVVAIEKKFGCRLEETQVRSMRVLGDVYQCCGQIAGNGEGVGK